MGTCPPHFDVVLQQTTRILPFIVAIHWFPCARQHSICIIGGRRCSAVNDAGDNHTLCYLITVYYVNAT